MKTLWFSIFEDVQWGRVCWQSYVFWVFLNSEGIIKMEYLEKGKTINGQYYASELKKLKKEIKLKCRENLRAGVLLLQNNVPIHTAQAAVAEAANCGFELLLHPSYLPDLVPSGFFLFSKLKIHLCGRHFGMRAYMSLKRFWRHRMPPSSTMGLQYENIIEPSAEILRKTTENSEKLSCSLDFFWFGLVSLFNGISTFVGYLMPNPFSKKNSSGTI